MRTEASRILRKRLRWAVRLYIVLLGLAFLALLLAAANSARTIVVTTGGGTTSTSVWSNESIGGLDPVILADWAPGVFLVLLLIGTVSVIVVSFLKRHSLAAVAGLLIVGFGISVSNETARNPEAGIVWATLGPLLLILFLALPVVGAARRAKLGSRWATYFAANDHVDTAEDPSA